MARTKRTPTAYDVARRAGVSQATVSYVLNGRKNGKTNISDETRQRILEAVEELGYVPNTSARSLRRQRTDRICVMLPGLGAPLYDRMTLDLQTVALSYGYSTVLMVGGREEQERHVLDQLQRRLADGILIIKPRRITGADLVPLVEAGLAVLAYDNYIEGEGFDVVRTLEEEASFQAANYLLDKGHRRIAFLGRQSDPASHQEAYEGYVRAMQSRGIPLDRQLVRAIHGSRERTYQTALDLLQIDERPTAIMCGGDNVAISAIWAVRDAGLRVPDDVAIVGSGNIPEGRVMHPSLTTVGAPSIDFSDIAHLLFSRLQSPEPLAGRTYIRPVELIIRESA